jgi:uncharacterized protein (DUF4415 family)
MQCSGVAKHCCATPATLELKKGRIMVIITSTAKVGQGPSKQERQLILAELHEAQKHPVNLDDCPELSPKVLKEFAMLRADKNRLKKRQTISIRLESSHIEKYKMLGKGYTGIMADILAYAADHPELFFQSTGSRPPVD